MLAFLLAPDEFCKLFKYLTVFFAQNDSFLTPIGWSVCGFQIGPFHYVEFKQKNRETGLFSFVFREKNCSTEKF